MKPKLATHLFLGSVLITEECVVMQSMNSDETSIFVLHNGEIKEVSKSLIKFKDE